MSHALVLAFYAAFQGYLLLLYRLGLLGLGVYDPSASVDMIFGGAACLLAHWACARP